MKILFVSFDADPPFMGGTATVANILAKSFQTHGHFCALAYIETSDHPSIFFSDKLELNPNNRVAAESFFRKHQFDIILNQLPTSVDYQFLMSLPIGNSKIISAYHNRPMLRPLLVENLMMIYSERKNIIQGLYTLLKIPLLPFLNMRSEKLQLRKLEDICRYSNKILLLSDKFYPVWKKLAPNTTVSKLVAIGNPLVFDMSLPLESIKSKENLVITVCSINTQKRAHLILKIWKKVEEDPSLDDWKFTFVGGGDGFDKFKTLAASLGLKRLEFVGYQNPYKYYKQASISLMTSRYEGWPMVLMEGQQMGVVPICYNSFESINDIIDDGNNGIIIPNNDLGCFVKKLKELMLDKSNRESMAINAIVSSERFSIDKVKNKYLKLFSSLIDAT